MFDWRSEFAAIFQRGGFDAVIGNPPYISVELTIKDVTDYYLSTFKSAAGRANSFSLFVERTLDLLKRHGRFGFIVSNRILTNTQLASLRKLVLENSSIENILTFKRAVFKAAVDTAVLICKKAAPPRSHSIDIWSEVRDLAKSDYARNRVRQALLLNTPFHVINVNQNEKAQALVRKILRNAVELSTICEVKDGIILGAIKDLFLNKDRENGLYEKWLEGNEVSRYRISWAKRYIRYDKTLIDEELKRKRRTAKAKAITPADYKKLARSGIWLRTPDIFRQDKILTRQNAKRLIGTLDTQHFFVKNSLHCILLSDKKYDLRYVLGLINSRLLDFYFQDQIGGTGELFSQMKIAHIRKLPVHPIEFSNKPEHDHYSEIIRFVDQILELERRLATAKIPPERKSLERQIMATDSCIDREVYALYGLTADEIKLVENPEQNSEN